MKIATKITPLSKMIGVENAVEALTEGGFRLFDYTPATDANMNEILKLMDKYDFTIYQTHGPDCRYSKKDAETYRKEVIRDIEKTAKVGAKYIAMHGNAFDYDNLIYSPEAALKYNYEVFAPTVEVAEKLGVKIAFENTFADFPERFDGKPHFCAKVEDQTALIDIFKSDYVCGCWDTGHAAIANKEKQPEAIKLLGKRIEITHVHDNNLVDDLHLVPLVCQFCEGSVDWNAVMPALKKYGNAEVLCFEPVYERIPQIAAKEYAKFHYNIGLALDQIQ